MIIIPSIDIINNQCVRLTQGDYNIKKKYDKNPIDIALLFQSIGINRLHIVDLEGAKSRKIVHFKTLEKISTYTNLVIDFGGGIQNKEDLDIVFNSGANMATIGSMAINNKFLFKECITKYGRDRIILGMDVKNEKITICGWNKITEYSVWTFIEEYISYGIKNILCTDIYKDGFLSGPSIIMYQKMKKLFPELNIIASGGVSRLKDILTLKQIGCYGVIIGKAIYENKIDITSLIKIC
jgi:phosphoribosylformimino-5-aminoimidazole carboxamide ribotide isomerase